MRDDFAVFILTHGRANNMYTYKSLKKAGYTGKIVFVLDNEDDTLQDYYTNFGEENCFVFDKKQVAEQIDTMDLSDDRRAIVFARNVCWDIAKKLGYKYFLQLDDDYSNFRGRVGINGSLRTFYVKDFDKLVDYIVDFLEVSGASTVAMSQIGDFIGGVGSKVFKERLTRKAMNSFFCKVDRPIRFYGRMNEDVTSYILNGSRGQLFFTLADVSVDHLGTQSIGGGMTASYKDSGTYIKSFYTVMACPSSVKVYEMGDTHKRIHHVINWEHAVPKIISSKFKKER